MPHAITIRKIGGPEQLEWGELVVPPPGPNEVQLEQTAVGLNFIDVYHRTGLYPMPLPLVLGLEGAGVVRSLGPGVTAVRVGDRVAYAGLAGAYATVRNAPVDRLVLIPDGLDDARAASLMLKGMTAEFLLRRCRPVGPGDTILFHAAAGGVGQLAVPWARHLGATVIGVVGRSEKVAKAREVGAHHVLLQGPELARQVKELTDGVGVQVVFDSVGKDTLESSLDSLAPRGMLVLFGQSSGKTPPLDLTVLGGARSLYITRPSLFAYIGSRSDLEASAYAVFAAVREGSLPVPPPTTFPLARAADAHRALEGRETTGAVVLVP